MLNRGHSMVNCVAVVLVASMVVGQAQDFGDTEDFGTKIQKLLRERVDTLCRAVAIAELQYREGATDFNFESFDAYHKWFAIRASQQPPDTRAGTIRIMRRKIDSTGALGLRCLGCRPECSR